MYEDGGYLSNNPSWHTENSAWKASQIRKILESNHIVPQQICEVGCGAGEVLRSLHLSFPEAESIGYDISPQAIEMCLPKKTERLEYLRGDLKEHGKHYQIVMAIDVMEHVEDYIGFLRNIKSFAKYVVLHVPLDLSVQSILRATPLSHARETVGHLHYFTKETALATIRHCGYRILDHFYTYLQLESPNRSLRVRSVAPLRRLALSVNEDLAVRLLGGCSLMVLAE